MRERPGVIGAQYRDKNAVTNGLRGNGFIRRADGEITLVDDPLAALDQTELLGINNFGLITGEYTDTAGDEHGLLLYHGTFSTLSENRERKLCWTRSNFDAEAPARSSIAGDGRRCRDHASPPKHLCRNAMAPTAMRCAIGFEVR
jgi:hypothetical protein